MHIQPKRTYFDEAYMRCLPTIWLSLVASVLIAGFAHAAPHKELAPLPEEALQAVRVGQHSRNDVLAEALEHHLHETRALLERTRKTATRLSTAGTAVDDEIASRRSESAAKRRQMLDLRNEVFARLDASIQADESRGDSRSAAEKRALRRQLGTRFADLDSDLAALQNASRGNFEARSRQAANRIEGWLAARPVAPLAPPNWTQAQPQPMVELPAAAEPPRFVLDTLWLLRHHFAAADGQMQVALRTTPSEASACGYNTADLASTPEAPKNHADIQALVQQLDHNPVRLFEWVRQNVAYEPYFGSLKGGLGALWSHSGGATDQASLLVALLRAANIPARYVRGTVSVLDASPKGADGRGPRWIGAKTYQAAASILASNGNPSASYGTNSVGLAHVWVEACLPYAAYRGAALDDSGHRWVPLDASYKDHRYQAGVGVDSTFDFNYTAWLASRIDAQGRYRLPQEAFEDQVEAHAKTKAPNYANTTLEDVPYTSEIRRQRFDILPIVPPYEVIKYDSWSGVAGESAETAALPDRHRHRLQVSVRNKSGTADPVAGNLLLQKTFNLAEVALARLTLSFKGATAADQSAFDAWFNAVDPAAAPTCAATANMAPSLKVSGTEQAPEAGSGSTPLCSTDNVMQLKVTVAELPANAGVLSQIYFTNIGAANLHALHAYAWHTSDTYLAKRSEQLLAAVRANSSDPNADRDGIEGEFLNLAASKYSRYVADASRRAGSLFGESGTVGISLGLTSAQVKVNYLFDLPYGLYRKGFLIDWPGGVYTGSRLDTPSTTDKRAFKLAGFAGSAYEAYIWQETAKLDAISTTRGLQFAKEQGIEILQINNATDWSNQKCKLTNTCADTALNTNPAGTLYSASHVSQIETSYVNQGFKLTLPRRLIQYPDSTGWKGATFYGEKFGTTSAQASFPINAYSGGMTIDPPAAGSDGSSPGSETPDGSASGGYAQGSATGSLYNPSLGTGIVADPYAPSFAQLSGLNGYQSALGFGSGSSVSGDPVNMVTGNLIHSERDIAIKGRGGLPLVFERWYNSQAAKDGPLGYGWTHSFNHRLRFYGVESGVAKVAWIDGTGGERYFATANHSSGNIATGATFSGSAGITATLERLADGTYRITERSGMQYRFENITASATDSGQKARLLSITDKNGNPLTLSYAPLGGCPGTDVCKVSDGLNRALTFTYSNARLSQISDWSGRSWQYSYDASGDLVTFKNPLAVSGSQPAVTYQYYTTLDSPKLAHAMKQYQLPRGNGMKFEYYANGRVFRHTPFASAGRLKEDHATSFAWAEFRREARQIDALGNERRFLFDKHGNPISITDEAGAETTYSYDATAGRTHLRLSKTDPQGMTTNYAYDTLGNLTDVTLPSARTLQYRDRTVFGQPKRIKDADGNWTLNRYDSLGKLTDRIATRVGVTPVADTRPASADIVAWTQIQADSVGNPIQIKRLRDWTSATLGAPTTGIGPSLETAFDANKLNPVSLTRRGDKDGTPATLETDVYSDFVHDNLGRMTRGPDQNWYPADSAFDALDRPIKSPDGRGHQWDTVYDANGNPVNLIDPMGFMATDPVKLADASGSQSYWGIAADIGVGFTPAGVVADVYSAATGKTAFGGQELSGWERALGLIPGVSEGMAVFRGGVKGAGAVADVAKGARNAPVEFTKEGERFVRVGAEPKNLNFTFENPGGTRGGTFAFPEKTFNDIGFDPARLKDLGDLPGSPPNVFRVLEPPVGTPVQRRGFVPGGEFGGHGGVPEVFFPKGF